jgi:hypothetical protein
MHDLGKDKGRSERAAFRLPRQCEAASVTCISAPVAMSSRQTVVPLSKGRANAVACESGDHTIGPTGTPSGMGLQPRE